MARPHKKTVDYFPHFCSNGSKTMYILEQKYGNDGYSFWFKVLEILAKADGHFFDFHEPMDWQFLLARTLVDDERAREILNTLVDLQAIDAELIKYKVIWVQNFVNNIADVYKRRGIPLPEKPDTEYFDTRIPS